MGREARTKKKERKCRKCKLSFLDMTAAQIRVHAFVCSFEKLTGIEIIKMGPANDEEVASENTTEGTTT